MKVGILSTLLDGHCRYNIHNIHDCLSTVYRGDDGGDHAVMQCSTIASAFDSVRDRQLEHLERLQ